MTMKNLDVTKDQRRLIKLIDHGWGSASWARIKAAKISRRTVTSLLKRRLICVSGPTGQHKYYLTDAALDLLNQR